MAREKYNVIGVMSGTSLDGLDIAYVSLAFDSKWTFDIITAETIPYPRFWNEKLAVLAKSTLQDVKAIDTAYTEYLSEMVNAFLKKHQITAIDAVCSHGHTAIHAPEQGFTYQIGNQKRLAEILGCMVVCDFRTQDVQLGGQGAPLVPIGDELLFSDFDYCLNLGGFSNLSAKKNGTRIAYDICPVNTVLNHYVKPLGLDYDDAGKIAESGEINQSLLDQLNQLDFYKQPPPKSLGIEWVNQEILPTIDIYHLNVKTILRTFVEHIAIQISKQITNNGNVLITGGGAYNLFLIERLKTHLNANVVIPEKVLVDFKEALIFGLLGVLKLRGEVNCLSSVTGSKIDHSSGVVFNV